MGILAFWLNVIHIQHSKYLSNYPILLLLI
jgi:hypothetical protein